MRKFFQIFLAAMFFVSATFAAAASFAEDVIEVEGVAYPEKGVSPNQLRRMAVLDAYRYLAEQTDTLYVTSLSTVKNMRELDDQINTKVEAALRGAKIISVTREKDGSFHAKAQLSMYGGSKSLAAAVLDEKIIVEDFPEPKRTNIISEINYTGLIIDCRGLNLSKAIAPAIKSVDGTEIYAYKNLGYQAAVDNGMVEYSSTLETSRAGSSPLIIKATKISGACDVVVSAQDADKILSANKSAKFLNNCLVVLVR